MNEVRIINKVEKLHLFSKYKKIILFGSGGTCNLFLEQFSKNNQDIAYCVDNNQALWGKTVSLFSIRNPNSLLSEFKEKIYIIVTSAYYAEIKCQLQKMGFIEYVNFCSYSYVNNHFESFLIRRYQNIHRNERAFIIGNGPSLRISDVEKLQNEITFGCNKIFLAFQETNWRPTYYALIDSMVMRNDNKKIQEIPSHKFISNSLKQYFSQEEGVCWLKDKGDRKFSDDIVQKAAGRYTVMFFIFQIAYFMGFTELYLLGVDFNYKDTQITGEQSSFGDIIGINQGEVNHFHHDYYKKGEKWNVPKINEQYISFQTAHEFLNTNGVKVYNASRETKLDVFPIVDFDTLVFKKM